MKGRALRVAVAIMAGGLALAQPAATGASGVIVRVIADALILFGAVFILAAALGLLRFPDFYTRLHASTKLVTLGGIGILGGAALVFAAVDSSERVLLIAAFFLLTAPLSGYMIAHSGYLSGLRPYREDSTVDEWGALGALGGPAKTEGEDERTERTGKLEVDSEPTDPPDRG